MLGANGNHCHGGNNHIYRLFLANRYSLAIRAVCWLCQGGSAEIGCDHCFRHYHAQCCFTDGRLITDRLFYLTTSGYKWVSKCIECTLIDSSHERWDQGVDFKKMSPRNVQRLISSIWVRITWCINPTIYTAVQGLGKTWVNCPINFETIELRVNNGTYQYPYQMLTDLSLINHNLRLVHKDGMFADILSNFMAFVYSLFNRSEACPYCLESSFSERPSWVIETCPWGHPLIFVNLKDQSWPGKLLRYHHHSNLVDVLLFGSLKWYQIAAKDCHHFVSSDYAIPITSPCHQKAVLDSLKYLNNIAYCFPTKITLNSLSVYLEIKDFVVISRDQSTNSSSSSSNSSTSSRSSIYHDKWTAERVATITHFIRNTENQIIKTTPFVVDTPYSLAVQDAKRLLSDDHDEDDESSVEEVIFDM